MNVPKSFIDYMKIMREHYKSGTATPDELPEDFNFDDIEIDANLYGFINQDDHSNHAKNNNTDSNKSPALEGKQATAKPEHNQQKIPLHTDIITIELFEQDNALMNTNSKPPVRPKQHLTLAEKIKSVFLNLLK